MIENSVLRKILEAGIRAPSGENAQPWRFRIEGSRVFLFNRPEADQSLFNYRQNGSMVAHGAFLENIRIAAGEMGYSTKTILFPETREEHLVATIDFEQTSAKREPLFDAIEKRVTNRKKYDASPLSEHEKKELFAVADGAVRLVVVDDRGEIGKLAHAASVSETMLVRNRHVHDFFFSHVRWTSEEEKIQPNGFYIKTLELDAQQAKGFKVLRSWHAARVLAKLGVAKKVGADNAATYKTASAMIGVIVKDSSPRNLVLAGQVFERAWLTATKLGLSVQPSTGALFLAEGSEEGNKDRFSESERKSLAHARETIYATLGVRPGTEHAAVLFRVGRSEPPSARAARFPVEYFLSVDDRT